MYKQAFSLPKNQILIRFLSSFNILDPSRDLETVMN